MYTIVVASARPRKGHVRLLVVLSIICAAVAVAGQPQNSTGTQLRDQLNAPTGTTDLQVKRYWDIAPQGLQPHLDLCEAKSSQQGAQS